MSFFSRKTKAAGRTISPEPISPLDAPRMDAPETLPSRPSPQDGYDTFAVEQIGEAVEIFGDPSRHAELGQKSLRLPDWFDFDLAPESPEYRDHQLRLWETITAREKYEPAANETTFTGESVDGLQRPAFYASGNGYIAGEHLLAMGLILLRSGAGAGSRVIEFGGGFGQVALAFARLGAKVDTVDIDPGFNNIVEQLASRYEVDLKAHLSPFGHNPAGSPGAYNVILFYESFHHCLDFPNVLPKLEAMLAEGGKILLAGEPIFRGEQPWMPVDWGIRLDWQCIAVMRIRGWMELGFREHYLTRQFMNHGFLWSHHAVPQAGPANLYEFVRWQHPMSMQHWPLSPAEEKVWHIPQPDGRWSRGASFLRLPRHHGSVEITCICHHASGREVRMTLGDESLVFHLSQGERKMVRLAMAGLPDQDLTIATNTDRLDTEFPDELGIFVETIRPVSGAD